MQESVTTQQPQEAIILQQIQQISLNMNGWLKFLGIMMIISGALTAISIVGILIAWLPIWLGVLLIQAGGRASNAQFTNNPQELVVMMDKLRLFFVILGILIIIEIAFIVVGIFTFGSILSRVMQDVPQF
jgi:hypothetical protein